jgi:hypothetical protein
MNRLLNIFTGVLSVFALSLQKLAVIFTFVSNEQLQRFIWYLTILWLLMQITMNAKKWFIKIKEFFRKGKRNESN